MSWRNLREDVLDEFKQSHSDRQEACLYEAHKKALARWADHGRRWGKTARGLAHLGSEPVKARQSAYAKKRNGLLKAFLVGVSVCRCGSAFAVSKYRTSRGIARTCGRACPALPQRQGRRLPCGLTMRELAARSVVPYDALRRRLRAGWSVDLAISTPVRPMRRSR